MKGFKFKLQNLLNIKEKFEQQAKIDYGEELARLAKEEEKLKDLNDTKLASMEKLRESFTGTINIHTYNEYNNYVQKLDKMIVEQEVEVKAQEERMNEAKRKLAEAVKERKTLEKLREKKVEEFKKEEQLAEDKLVDELVTYKFGAR